jgi:hypothetical protein
MTLHGDRPSNADSGSASPSAGSKRPASPKLDTVQAVKKSKSGSDSPATRTVIEVLNTPSVDSPLPRTENGSNGDGYFKGVLAKNSESNGSEAAVQDDQEKKDEVVEPVEPESAATSAAAIEVDEPKVPALSTEPAALTGDSEDVTMSEAEQPAQAVEPATAPTTIAESDSAAATAEISSITQPTEEISTIEPAPVEPSAIEPVTSEAVSAEPATSAMEVDPPVEVDRPLTPELPAPPAPISETVIGEAGKQLAEDEKKE